MLFAALVMGTAGLSAKGSVDSELAKEYFEIAQAYAEVSKYDKAVEFYRKAAKDSAHKNAAEYNLARVYGLQGYWSKAKPIFERQYKDAPGNILILKAYAYSLAATGEHARACEMYKTVYDNDTEDPEAALNYARILVLTKRYEDALTFIEELKTRFTETAEKKVLDELEEKIKNAQSEPEKRTEPTEKAESTETKSEGVEAEPEASAVKTEDADSKAKNAKAADPKNAAVHTEEKK